MLLIITGKTTAGKDTIIAKILEKYPNFARILTATSRRPRKEEENGRDYHFISLKDFQRKIKAGDFLEHVQYGGNYYGTEKSRVNPNKNLIWKTDPSFAGKAKKLLTGFDLTVIYLMVDDQTVLQRLTKRGLSEREIAQRMADDQKYWEQFKDQYDYIVLNKPGKLDRTVSEVAKIIDKAA